MKLDHFCGPWVLDGLDQHSAKIGVGGEALVERHDEALPSLEHAAVRPVSARVETYQPALDADARRDLQKTANSTVRHISPIHDSSAYVPKIGLNSHFTQVCREGPDRKSSKTGPVNSVQVVPRPAATTTRVNNREPRHPSVETAGNSPVTGDGGRGFFEGVVHV